MLVKLKSLFVIIFILTCFNLNAQKPVKSFEIQGLVVDQANEPLAGASVRVDHTTRGTITNINGKFHLKVHKGEHLIVEFLGMLPYRFTANAKKTDLHIKLLVDDNALNEVVVTGYKTEKTRNFVGSASRIDTKDFIESPYADFTKLLESKAPGLNISNISNTFGAAPKINIRGGGSINASVQPLWVVDGSILEDIVPLNPEELVSGDPITLLGSSIAGLNPSDIASIEVLKDATATSLYGAKGMNGVIVITTKSAKRNSGLALHYDYVSSFREKPSYSNYDRLNSLQSMEIYQDMDAKGFFNMEDALWGRRGGIYSQFYKMLVDKSLKNTPENRQDFFDKAALRNTDWFDKIYRNTITQRHSLSLSYGGDKGTTYASLSYYNDPGQTIVDNVKRLTGNIKNIYYFNDKLKLTLSLQANYRKQKGPGSFERRQSLELGEYRRDFDINPFQYALNTSRTLAAYNDDNTPSYYRNEWANFNIFEEYKNNFMNLNVQDIRSYIQTEYSPLKSLKLTALFNVRVASTAMKHIIGENSNVISAMRANENPVVNRENIYLYRPNPSATGQIALPKGGILNVNTRSMESYLGRLSAEFNKNFGKHNLNVFAFSEFKAVNYDINSNTGYGISYDRSNSIATTPLIFEKTLAEGKNYFSSQQLYDRDLSLSLSGNYSYADKYVANLVLNYEGSNAAGLSSRVRFLPTWNVGLKWNADKENFFKKFRSFINLCSVHASYGLVARMNPAAINSLAVYNSTYAFRENFENRADIITLKHQENRDLTWEKMYEANLGTNLTFLDGKITTAIDVYNRKSFDLIDYVRTSGIGGESVKLANYGDMVTRGIDFNISTINYKAKSFEWRTTLSYSYYNQQITKLRNTPNAFDLVSGGGRANVVGFPRASLYSYDFKGLTDRGLPSFRLGNLPNTFNNKDLYEIAGANFYDAKYDRSYLLYNGPLEPNSFLGLYNSFKFGNFNFSFFISGKFGSVLRRVPSFDPLFKDLNVFTHDYLNRWRVKGDEARTNIPTIPGRELIALYGANNIERAYNTYNYSQVNVLSGSFIRLNTISLSYSIPASIRNLFHLNSAVISLQAQNLCLLYADSALRGQDPEYINSGGVASPAPRSYSFSLNLNF